MAEHLVKVLIIDEDTSFLDEAAAELSAQQFQVATSSTGREGIKICNKLKPQVVIMDTGLSDIPFSKLIEKMKGVDKAAMRIATSRDYSAIEDVMEAINTSGIHKYFRKPVNYFDIIQAINAATQDYRTGMGLLSGKDTGPAYGKLETIIDRAKVVEKLRKQLESQLTKVKDVEAESFKKMKDALDEANGLKKKIGKKDEVINRMQERSLELEDLKKRDIDRIERDRDDLKREFGEMQEAHDLLVKEKDQIDSALKEIEISRDSEKQATLQVSEDLKRADREKKGGKDSILVVDDESEITEAFTRLMRSRFNVYTADNGRNALKVLEDNPDICIIVTDQRMPEMTGLELAAEVRSRHADMPVYLMTGYTDMQVAIDAMNTGAIMKYFDKPVDWEDLEAELNSGIERYDLATAQQEILTEKKTFIVDRIRELSAAVDGLKYSNTKQGDEIGLVKSKNEKLAGRIENFSIENSELRTSVARERKVMLEDMTRERKNLDEEIARKKEEAGRIVEMQKEKNKAELQMLRDEFEEEKQKAAAEVEQLKAELEQDRQAKLAAIEQERKRAEDEQKQLRKKLEAEKEEIKEHMRQEQQKAEAEQAELRKKLEAEQAVMREQLKQEQKKAEAEQEEFRQKLESEKAEIKEKMKQEQQKAEAEQADLRKKLEAEKAAIEKSLVDEKQKAAAEIERMKAEMEQDRKAKLAEIEQERQKAEAEQAQLRSRLATEKEELEKKVREQQEKAEADIRGFQESFALEKKTLTEHLEAELDARKKTAQAEATELRAEATRNYDTLKVESEKKEHEMNEALIQTRRVLKEKDEQVNLVEARVKGLEAEVEKSTREKDKAQSEIESMQEDYELALQSREALEAEMAELRDMLK